MKYKIIIILLVIVAAIASSCDRDELFTREHYKAVVAVKSEGGFNVFAQEHDLAKLDANGFSDGFISANIGGSLPTTEPVRLSIVMDDDLLQFYNQRNFGTESYRYAHFLNSDRFSVANMSINIPAGERNGRMNIRVSPGGLSPDSIYLIPFRVDNSTAYELNIDKSTVLYQVQLKNFWSTTRSIPSYNNRGTRYSLPFPDKYVPPATVADDGDVLVGTPSYMTKSVYPVSADEVRFFGGHKTYNSRENQEVAIAQWSVRVKIHDIGKVETGQAVGVTISAWNTSNDGFKVTQMNGDERYPNTFQVVNDGFGKLFKTFLLCYQYTDPTSGSDFLIKEELSIEYVKEVK